MPKKPSGPNVLVKVHLSRALYERLKAHCGVTRLTVSAAVAELVQDNVFNYARLRKNPRLLDGLVAGQKGGTDE